MQLVQINFHHQIKSIKSSLFKNWIFLEMSCRNDILSFMRVVLTCTKNTDITDDDYNIRGALDHILNTNPGWQSIFFFDFCKTFISDASFDPRSRLARQLGNWAMSPGAGAGH